MSNYFSWERKYNRTWEAKNNGITDKKANKWSIKKDGTDDYKRLGLIRHLCIVIDKSVNIDLNDFLPSFRVITKEKLIRFIEKFSEENPISKLSLSIVQDEEIESNIKFLETPGSGNFSLQNALETGYEVLHKSSNIKELILISFSVSIKDTFDVEDSIKKIISKNIKVSVINMCAELSILKRLCERTGGCFYVPLDEYHYECILMSFLIPKGVSNSKVNLIPIGFPEPENLEENKSPICTCHLKAVINLKNLFRCVRCKSIICDLPVECPICGLLNINSMNLCGNIHHMYPLKSFQPYEGKCFVCDSTDNTKKCEDCEAIFCSDCDYFIHDNLNQCCYCEK